MATAPTVFTYRRQRPDVVDGAASHINLVFHHTLLVAHRLLGPIHPQQPITKVCKVKIQVLILILLTSHGLTGPKCTKRHAAVTIALSPHSRDVRHVVHNQGATDDRGDPTRGRPARCIVRAPPPCSHWPTQATTSHRTPTHDSKPPRPAPGTTTHNTQHTKPQQSPPLVPGHSTRPNCPCGPRHATSPQRSYARPGHTSAHCTSQAHSMQGKSRRLLKPMHQPGPPHASADGAPHPFPCHAAPTRQPAHNTRKRHSTAPLPPPPDSAAEPPDPVAPPHSYRPLPALPTHHQQFAGDIGTQVGHGSLGGWTTSTRAAAVAALRPPPPQGAGLFTLFN
jgi:hypothetical protein